MGEAVGAVPRAAAPRRARAGRDPAVSDRVGEWSPPERQQPDASAEEIRGLVDQLQGIPRVVCILLYGSGLRLLEALELRVKDVDFAGGEIRVRRAKGRKTG